MKIFLKSIIVGLGGIAPGLSGSVLMIIFGLYQDVLEALGTLFIDFKKKLRFLLPVLSGMVVGVLLFSKILNFFLINYEVPTRFLFLGLILGTVPLFYKEVKKEGFYKKYYFVILAAVAAGIFMFGLNPDKFSQVTNPNLFQKIILGIAAAASAIIPGVDPAVLLSSLGLYEIYVSALATLNFEILLPMALGLCIGGISISFLMSNLFRHFYTITFSVVFGIFLSMIPNMLNENCYIGWDVQSFISIILVVLGFIISYYMEDIQENNRKLKNLYYHFFPDKSSQK